MNLVVNPAHLAILVHYEPYLFDHSVLGMYRLTERSSEGVVLVFYFLSGPQEILVRDSNVQHVFKL
jgi:hypothetical protein